MTISFHNGSKARRAHNIRDPRATDQQAHIDPAGHHETWIDEEPAEAYRRIFGDALEEYNARTRPDRRIKDYFRKVEQSDRKHPVYECIITIGNGHSEMPRPEDGREIFREFVKTWPQRNPNLHLIGAYYHADEPGAAPHVHIDYIPVYHGTRGMRLQTGLAKALQEQGYTYQGRHSTEQIQWQNRERDALETLCIFKGYEIQHPGRQAQHLETRLYKTQKALETVTRKYSAVIAAAGLAANIARDMEREQEQAVHDR